MFRTKPIVSAVEIGTSKTCVLIGESQEDGRLRILGHGEAPSGGHVVKGEIVNVEGAYEVLADALEQADRASGRMLTESKAIAVAVTGAGIESHQGVGAVFVNTPDGRVGENEMFEAIEHAKSDPLPNDQMILNTSESCFVLDGMRRVRNPINQSARRLEAIVHIIHGNVSRIENFKNLLIDNGLIQDIPLIFSGAADGLGIFTEDDKENGALLIDLGAGCTEYIAGYDSGVLASGILPIGFEHVANDLSQGLKLEIGVCRRLLAEDTLNRLIRENAPVLELGGRKISMEAVNKIIEMRLRELFEIIRDRLREQQIMENLSSGAVLTGGGALFVRSPELFKSVFEMPVKIGKPYDADGAVTGIDTPRYSTIWGTLKFADMQYRAMLANNTKRGLSGAVSALQNVVNRSWRTLRDTWGAFKI